MDLQPRTVVKLVLLKWLRLTFAVLIIMPIHKVKYTEWGSSDAYRRPTILVALDFKGGFDSVDRIAVLNVLAQQGIPLRFVKNIRSLYSQTQGQVRVYGKLSKGFPNKSGVRQSCFLSLFLFDFVIDEIMKRSTVFKIRAFESWPERIWLT